ncbi:MAG: PfkB family carbohydrate kinase, partial [Pseudomonadota bacterium]
AGRDGMLQHAQQFVDRGIPFVFDPGQGLPMFGADDLAWFIERAHYIALNDYEAKMLVEKTGLDLAAIARKVEALVVTRGSRGSEIHVRGERLQIPVAPAREVVDPTGCGDAYRAGLLYGIDNGLDWGTTGRLAAVMGALKVERGGAQNHTGDRTVVADRFFEAFGYRPW